MGQCGLNQINSSHLWLCVIISSWAEFEDILPRGSNNHNDDRTLPVLIIKIVHCPGIFNKNIYKGKYRRIFITPIIAHNTVSYNLPSGNVCRSLCCVRLLTMPKLLDKHCVSALK